MDSLSFDDVPFERDTPEVAPDKVDYADVSRPQGERPARPARPAITFDDVPFEEAAPSGVQESEYSNPMGDPASLDLVSDAVGAVRKWGVLTPEEGEAEKKERIERARQQKLWADQQRADIEGRMGEGFIPGQTLQEEAAADSEKVAKGPAPTLSPGRSAAEGFIRETGRGIVSLAVAPGITVDFIDWAASGDTNESGYTKAVRGYSDAIKQTFPGDPTRQGELIDQLASGGGSMTSMLVGGAALKAAGVPAKVGQYYAGISQGGTQGYEDAEANNATPWQKYKSFFLNAGLGATEAIPISRAFDRLNDASGGKVQQILFNSTANSLEEFIQELGQGLGQNIIANWAAGYDPDRATTEGVAEQAAVGFILGGVMGAGMTALSPSRPQEVNEKGGAADERVALQSTDVPGTKPDADPAVTAAVAASTSGAPPVEESKSDRIKRVARERDQKSQPIAPTTETPQPEPPPAAGTEPPPAVGAEPAAPPNSAESLKDIGQGATAIVDNMYADLWAKVEKGDTTENGNPSTLLAAAKMLRDRGGLTTPDQFRAFANEYSKVPSGPDFSSNLKQVMTKYLPGSQTATSEVTPVPPVEQPASQTRKVADLIKPFPGEGYRVGQLSFEFNERNGGRYLRVRDRSGKNLLQASDGGEPGVDVTDIWSAADPNQFEARQGNKVGINSLGNNVPTEMEPIFREWLDGKINEEEALARIGAVEVGGKQGIPSAAPEAVVPPPAADTGMLEKAASAIQESGVTSPYWLGRMMGISANKAGDLMLQLAQNKRLVEFKNNKFKLIPATSPSNVDANTTPEAAATLSEQQQALIKGTRRAVFYPDGTKPAAPVEGSKRIKVPGAGIFDYNPGKVTPKEIRDAAKAGRLNELLDLGPYNKQDVVQSAVEGNAPVGVVERTPDGTEVKAAFGATATAPDQVATLEATKAEPQNTVAVEPPAQVVKGRVLADQSAESQYARELQAEQNAEIKKRARQELKPPKEEAPKGKNRTKAEKAKRLEANNASDQLFADTAPSNEQRARELDFLSENAVKRNAARSAIRGRAEAILRVAKEAGVRLPTKVQDNADTSMDLSNGALGIENARNFLNALKAQAKPAAEIYQDFLTNDMLIRAGDRDAVIGLRRAEGDIQSRTDTTAVLENTASEAPAAEQLVASKQEGDEQAADTIGSTETAPRPEAVEAKEGETYSVGRATKAPTVETKKKRVVRRRESIGGNEAVVELDDADVLQEVTFAQALEQAGEVKGNALNRSIVNRILTRLNKQVGQTPIKIVSQETLNSMFPDRKPGAVDGYYDPQKDHIVLSANFLAGGQFDAQILAHEGVHAYLQRAIDNDATLRKDIEDVLEYAKSVSDNPNAYGFKDVHEFLAEALSNPEFQNMLANTRMPPKLARRFSMPTGSLWQGLVSAIRKHLGLGRRDVDALSMVLRLAERAANSAEQNPDADIIRGLRQKGLLSEGRQKRNYRKELIDAGVSPEDAAEIATLIETDLADVVPEDIDGFIADLAKEFAKPTSASKPPKEPKEAKAKIDKEAKKIIRKVEKSAQDVADEAYLQALDAFKPGRVPLPKHKLLLNLMMNNQLALVSDKVFGRDTNPIRRIADLIEKRRTAKARYLEDLAAVPEELRIAEAEYSRDKEGRKNWENFVTLAHDATMAQVHPDKPLDHKDHKHLGKNALNGMWGKRQHAKLATRYNGLPPDLQRLYRVTRDILTETQNRIGLEKIRVILKALGHNDVALAKRFFDKTATKDDVALVGDIVANHIQNAGELTKLAGPYFNLVRRGDWVVQGFYDVTVPSNGRKISSDVVEFKSRDDAIAYINNLQDMRPTVRKVLVDQATGETYFTDDDGTEVKVSKNDASAEERYRVTVQNRHVEFFSSKKEAEQAAKDLRKAGVKIKDVEPKRYERNALNGDMLSDQFRALAATLRGQDAYKSLSDKEKTILVNTLNEASLRFLGSTRIQSHRLPRRYVQGASKDLVLNTYDYVDSAAGYLAKLDTELQMEEALRQAEKGVDALSQRGAGLGTQARAVLNEMQGRVLDVNYDSDQGVFAATANRMMMVNFVNHLASPFYSVLQTMQVGMLTLPRMAAEYGEARAAAQIAKAYYDIGAGRRVAKAVGATAKALAGYNTAGRTYVDDIKASLNNAEEKKLIDDLVDLGVLDADSGFEVNRLTRQDSVVLRGVDTALGYFGSIARQAPQSIEAVNRAVTGLATFRMELAKTKNYDKALRAAQEMVELTQFNLSASNAAPAFKNPVGRLLLQFKKYGQNVYFSLGRDVGRAIRPMEKGERVKAIKGLGYMLATHAAVAGFMGLPWEAAKIGLLVFNAAGITDMEWDDFENLIEEYVRSILGEDDENDDLTDAFLHGLPRLADMNLSSRVGLSDLLLYGEPGDMNDRNSVKSWILDVLLGPSSSSAQDTITGVSSMVEGRWLEGIEKLMPVKVIGDAINAYRKLDEGKFDVSDAIMRTIGVQSARQAKIQDNISDDISAREKVKAARKQIIKDWKSATTAAEKAKIIARMREYNRTAKGRDRLTVKFLRKLGRQEEKQYQDE